VARCGRVQDGDDRVGDGRKAASFGAAAYEV
jgi:hypothetical protein